MCLGVAALPGKRSGFDLESLVGRENNSRAFPTACWNPGIFGHPFLLGEQELQSGIVLLLQGFFLAELRSGLGQHQNLAPFPPFLVSGAGITAPKVVFPS